MKHTKKVKSNNEDKDEGDSRGFDNRIRKLTQKDRHQQRIGARGLRKLHGDPLGRMKPGSCT